MSNSFDMLRYMQRESARCSWEARQENDAIGWREWAGLNEYCWHCCEGLKGLQLAAADWHAAIEATRDGRFDSLRPSHQRAHKLGCAEFMAADTLAKVRERVQLALAHDRTHYLGASFTLLVEDLSALLEVEP